MGSSQGSIRSGGTRVHKIIDDESQFDSDNGWADPNQINEVAQEEDEEELKRKREKNVYDVLQLQKRSDATSRIVESLISKHQSKSDFTLSSTPEKSVYSEVVSVYINKTLKQNMLVIYEGFLYLI